MKRWRSFAALLVLGGGLCAARLRAELKWSAVKQDLQADPAKTEVAAAFSFVNAGERPIRIVELAPSCGCTSATLEKRSYAPGETGRIDVVIRYDAGTSQLQQSVMVVTDEAKNARQLLTVSVTVPGKRRAPERIEASPAALEWAQGSPRSTRVIALRVSRANDAIRPVSAADDTDAFAVVLRQPDARDPRAFELLVTPRRTDRPARATIVIRTNSKTFRPDWMPEISYQVTATVK